jgi:hypothetical protein
MRLAGTHEDRFATHSATAVGAGEIRATFVFGGFGTTRTSSSSTSTTASPRSTRTYTSISSATTCVRSTASSDT